MASASKRLDESSIRMDDHFERPWAQSANTSTRRRLPTLRLGTWPRNIQASTVRWETPTASANLSGDMSGGKNACSEPENCVEKDMAMSTRN